MDDQKDPQNQPASAEPPASSTQPEVTAPPAVSSTPVTTVIQPSTSPAKKSKIKLIIAIIVATALVAGASVIGAIMYLNNQPEKVLADALTNTAADLLEGKPASTVGSLVFESKGTQPVKLTVKFDGSASGENSASSADLNVAFGGKTYNLKTSATLFGDNEYYFKIENLEKTLADISVAQPGFVMYTQYLDPIVAKLDNKWVKVTKADLAQLGSVNEETVDKCTAAVKSLKLSNDDKKQLKKLFKQNQFIVASEKLTTEKVASEDSFHYKLDFNNKAAENFAKQVTTMESFTAVKNDCDLTDKKLEDGFKKSGAKSSSPRPVVELWVGKDSRRPTKFRVSANNKDMTIDFNTVVKLNATDIKIEKPTDSISINELKAEIEKLVPSSTTNLQTL